MTKAKARATLAAAFGKLSRDSFAQLLLHARAGTTILCGPRRWAYFYFDGGG